MSYGRSAWNSCEMKLEATIPVTIKMEPIQLLREFAKAMACEAVFDEDFDFKYNIKYDNTNESYYVTYQDNDEVFDDRGELYYAMRDLIECL